MTQTNHNVNLVIVGVVEASLITVMIGSNYKIAKYNFDQMFIRYWHYIYKGKIAWPKDL